VDAREVDVAFQAGGRIAQLHADEGQVVSSGDLLAELDTHDYQLALSRAQSESNAAGQTLAALKAGTREQEIRVGEANLAQARASQKFARDEVKRVADLVSKNFISQQQLDAARQQADIADAQVEQARQSLNLLRAGPRKEDIQRAAAQFEASKAAVAQAQRQLDYAKLASPVNGVVSVRLAEQGQVVASGQPILRIAELEKPWVRAFLGEPDLPRVKLGQAAEVRVDGLPDKVFKGRLVFISPQAEFTPKTVETHSLRVDLVYRIKVEVDAPGGELKIGMPADVSFPADNE
jgi:HlyD family secretion protein